MTVEKLVLQDQNPDKVEEVLPDGAMYHWETSFQVHGKVKSFTVYVFDLSLTGFTFYMRKQVGDACKSACTNDIFYILEQLEDYRKAVINTEGEEF